MTASLCYLGFVFLVVTRSLSGSLAAETHSQLTSQKHTTGRRGMFAFMGAQRPHLENRCHVLSSCLANTQLYTANTIEQRAALLRQSSFCVVACLVCLHGFDLLFADCVEPVGW